MKIYYIGYFDLPTCGVYSRKVSPAACEKMDYVASTLGEISESVLLVSIAPYRKHVDRTAGNSAVQSSHPFRLKFLLESNFYCNLGERIQHLLVNWLLLPVFVFSSVRTTDVVVAYHSPTTTRVIKYLKAIIGFRLLLQVEEVYADASNAPADARDRELRSMSNADAFILPTSILERTIPCNGKPTIIAHGNYLVEVESLDSDKRNPQSKTSDAGKAAIIDVVYAGTFSPQKGGAQAAVRAAPFLPPPYRLNIMGFGSPNEVAAIRALIEQTQLVSSIPIRYLGLVVGSEYSNILQQFAIGLSVQDPNGEYNCTSFPSKVLSYLRNGLQVVSVELEVLKTSALDDIIFYTRAFTPSAIGEAITSVDVCAAGNGIALLDSLHRKFRRELSDFILDSP